MRASLENLLSESLDGLRNLSAPVADSQAEAGPVEGLTTITAEQIAAEVTEHIKDERYNDTENCRQECEDILLKNEEDHAALRKDIAEVSETVQNITAAMEMASLISSMESFDENDLEMANTAFSNIANQVGDDAVPPVLVAEGGQLTTASMESVGNFLKDLLTRLKKWIKEKFENMAISFRRDNMGRAILNKRLDALVSRLQGMPQDYGIPSKALRLDPRYTACMYFGDKPVNMKADEFKSAMGKIITAVKRTNVEISEDAIKRSDAIGDVIASVLVSRDGIQAEEMLRKLFKDVTGPLPAYDISKGLGEVAGLTFYDAHTGYRSRYRDVEWILELVNVLEAPAVASKPRRVAQAGGEYSTVEDLNALADELRAVINDHDITDATFYVDICMAWRNANEVYNRLWEMVNSMSFPQMNNELWRAFDIGTTAMFSFLEKAYNSVMHLRVPYFRYVDANLYIMEEQMKAYVAVNR